MTTAMQPTATMDGGMSMQTSASDSGAAMGMMPMSMMYMVFYASPHTALYSMSWEPQTVGQYAGTCIFLITLGSILRTLFAFKSLMERRWAFRESQRRYDTAVRKGRAESALNASEYKNPAVVTQEVADESPEITPNNVISLRAGPVSPWRLTVDVPRALLVTVMGGVGYLLMLAVCTMNVGYFMSVLGGIFLGELFLGRYNTHAGGAH